MQDEAGDAMMDDEALIENVLPALKPEVRGAFQRVLAQLKNSRGAEGRARDDAARIRAASSADQETIRALEAERDRLLCDVEGRARAFEDLHQARADLAAEREKVRALEEQQGARRGARATLADKTVADLTRDIELLHAEMSLLRWAFETLARGGERRD